MRVVYRATQRKPNRTVALKVIRSQYAADPEFRRRFDDEAEAAAEIQSPRVIPMCEAGAHGGVLFLAMAYIGGFDLRRWLGQHGRMPPQRAVGVITQIAEALDAAD